ncbi:MAG TPA: hypothetical protein VFZ71_04070 [Pyrinomonadaceae bacterium]
MARNDFQGWLPVDAVVVDGRPGLLWMNMTGVELVEPFFQQTVDRLRSARPARDERFTEFDTLVQLEKSFATVPPSGFIFHSSRCGSTLLANACRALDGAIVLSEPAAVDKLVARFITDVDEHGSTREILYSIFLRATVAALGQRRTGRERQLFIKFACCSVSQIERIRRIWPNVPWVFLYRDPIETVVSNMQNLPAWLQDEDHRVLASITGTATSEVAEMTKEELCARSIAAFYTTAGAVLSCEPALSRDRRRLACSEREARNTSTAGETPAVPGKSIRKSGPGPTAHRVANDHALLLNYKQLSTAEISNVLKFFGASPTAAEMETIARQSQNYSKATSARTFAADAEKKHTLATDLIREVTARWADKPYQLLEQKRLGILKS